MARPRRNSLTSLHRPAGVHAGDFIACPAPVQRATGQAEPSGRISETRRPNLPADEPRTTLTKWGIHEFSSGQWHLVGNITATTVRVSSAVAWFDLESLSGTTVSGREYRLAGAPGLSEEAMQFWFHWCAHYGTGDARSVSADVWELHMKATTCRVTNWSGKT